MLFCYTNICTYVLGLMQSTIFWWDFAKCYCHCLEPKLFLPLTPGFENVYSFKQLDNANICIAVLQKNLKNWLEQWFSTRVSRHICVSRASFQCVAKYYFQYFYNYYYKFYCFLLQKRSKKGSKTFFEHFYVSPNFFLPKVCRHPKKVEKHWFRA